MNVHLALLLVYSVVLIALGAGIGRLVKTTGAFFVAGRRLGPVLLFSTLLAAKIGAGSTVGAAGLGYRDGLSAWWWVGSAGIGSLDTCPPSSVTNLSAPAPVGGTLDGRGRCRTRLWGFRPGVGTRC